MPWEGSQRKRQIERGRQPHWRVSGSSYRLGDSVLEFYTQKTNSPPPPHPGQTGEMLGQVKMLESLDSTHADVSLPPGRTSLMAQTIYKLPVMQQTQFDPWCRDVLWKREWLPTPVFLPGKSHGQRSLVGYSPWGCKELDTTK